MRETRPGGRIPQWLLVCLRLGIAALCLAFVYVKLDLVAGMTLLVERPELFALLPFTWVLNQFACALRIRALFRAIGGELTVRRAVSIGFMSFFFASVLPGVVAGDLAKVAAVRTTERNSRIVDITLAVLMDRFLGLFTLVLFAAAFSIAVPAPDSPPMRAMLWMVRISALVATVGVVGAMLFAGRLLQIERVRGWVERRAGRFGSVTRIFQPEVRGELLRALAWSMAAIAPLVLGQAVVGAVLAGGDVLDGIRLQAFLAPASIVVSGLSLTPAGVGVGQLTLAGLFELSEIPQSLAVAVSTATQLAQVLSAVVVGLPAFMLMRRGRQAAAEPEATSWETAEPVGSSS